ncbi:TPA: hypothetical protein ACF35N_004502 [Vibrio parahaemolyticus]
MKTGKKTSLNNSAPLNHFFKIRLTDAQKSWLTTQPNASQLLRDAIDAHMQDSAKELSQEV